jgi:hypothetical protein
MKVPKLFVIGMMVIVAAYLAGCCGGSKETVVVPQGQTTTTPTLGQELQDLEEAYKKGAISKDEYETAKKKILEQKTK